METNKRFYVDARIGCVAVRDRTIINNSPGLHEDDPDVVWFKMRNLKTIACPRCGNNTTEWDDDQTPIEEAILFCGNLNANEKEGR